MSTNTLQPLLDFYRENGGECAWSQGAFARDSEGREVSVGIPNAVSWCLSGALTVLKHSSGDLCRELRKRIKGYIVEFNDDPSTDWPKVRELLSREDVT